MLYPFLLWFITLLCLWCSCYFLSSFNLGLKMERKLKTVNTLKLREMLRRRFTSYTSLTLVWEMMEYTLLLPQTVGERVARLQNFMYIVSRVILTVGIICWYCRAPLLLLKSEHKLLQLFYFYQLVFAANLVSIPTVACVYLVYVAVVYWTQACGSYHSV